MIKKIVTVILTFIGALYQVTLGFIEYLKCPNPKILINAKCNKAKKVCIFAAYRSNLDPILKLTLDELKRQNFVIIYVSNKMVNEKFIKDISKYANFFIQRGNYGRCIAAYKTGFLFLKSKNFLQADNLLFMNDTNIFPIGNTAKFWKEMNESKADINGIYESIQINYHVQSYFLYCKNKVFLNTNFIKFWENYLPLNSRFLLIRFGEIGFSRMALKAGLSLRSYVNFERLFYLNKNTEKLIPYNRYSRNTLFHSFSKNSNPSHTLALISLVYFDLPLVKSDLLSRKTFHMLQFRYALKKINQISMYDILMDELSKKIKKETLWNRIQDVAGMT